MTPSELPSKSSEPSPEDAVERLFTEDRAWVVAVARALVLDASSAEDLAHDASRSTRMGPIQ